MNYELLYSLANATAAVCWLPLVFAPRSAFTSRYTATPIAPLVFALVYAALTVRMLTGDGDGGMGSLAMLRRGFEQDPVLLLAWVHYLSFDMMVGFWELRDSRRLGLNPWLVAPCLVFTFLLGPVGLLLYCGLRLATRGSLSFDVDGAGSS